MVVKITIGTSLDWNITYVNTLTKWPMSLFQNARISIRIIALRAKPKDEWSSEITDHDNTCWQIEGLSVLQQ
jgi:hypothetical protein